ncbi:MAG: hypothetical protein BGO98_13885 [Myxococcales bacterium 68-20]|nr:hypothetical protein [Myxococcales bacterium]OJY21061.1 MAG: hypothetical protein BGO98_13885 [Myxococcales bacterium 68-20]
MFPSSSKQLLTVTLTGAVLIVVVAACGSSVDRGVDAVDAGPSGFGAAPADGGDAAVVDAPVHELACIATACPEGFATCADGTGPAYKCGADLKRDPDNCGGCGNKCLLYAPIHMSSRCVEGTCELECFSPYDPGNQKDWRNCDGKVDNGCEADVLTNVKHCGACGNACAPGEPCIDGVCGCEPGEIVCHGQCVDPKTDDNHCNGCDQPCDPEGGTCGELPNGAYYGCYGGVCGTPKCKMPTADCNGDLGQPGCNSDGCEVPDVRTDPNNCGGCGIKCKAGEECVNEGNGPECAVPCVRFGKVLCPFGQCRDLLNDVMACGSCSRFCQGAGPNQVSACRKGICELDCLPGFADCNGDPSDGCETNVMAHPGNCGTCGNACDVAGGQPCIEGKCLMTECDAGTVF